MASSAGTRVLAVKFGFAITLWEFAWDIRLMSSGVTWPPLSGCWSLVSALSNGTAEPACFGAWPGVVRWPRSGLPLWEGACP